MTSDISNYILEFKKIVNEPKITIDDESVIKSLTYLSDREKDILIKRYVNKMTFKQIGETVFNNKTNTTGVSSSMVNVIFRKSIRKFLHDSRSDVLSNWIMDDMFMYNPYFSPYEKQHILTKYGLCERYRYEYIMKCEQEHRDRIK